MAHPRYSIMDPEPEDTNSKNLQIVPFFPKAKLDVTDDLEDLMLTSPSPINSPTTPASVVEPEIGLVEPEISSTMVCGGGGGAFSQSICAVKSCQQVIVKLPSRPGYVVWVGMSR